MSIDVDRTLKILLIIILAAVVGYFGWQVVQRVFYPLELFLMGAIVAFILSPLVDKLHESGFPRPLAILTVYIIVLFLMSLLGFVLINPLLGEIQTLIHDAPNRFNDLRQRLTNLRIDQFLHNYGLPTTDVLKNQAVGYLNNLGQTLFENLGALVLTSFSFLINCVLVLVIAFYLLLDGEQLKERLYGLVPDSQLSRVTFVEATVNEVLGGYLRGQLLMALTIGTMAGVSTDLLGVSYPYVVGVLAGILELVPMLGPWLASMPGLVIAAISPHPFPLVLWVGLAFLLIQQLESNVIGPRITGHAVGLHPLAALMALLVGIEIYGILGALFAVPVAGMLYVFGLAIYYHVSGRPQPARRPVSGSLLGNLGGKMLGRGPDGESTEPTRQILSGVLRRRAATEKVFPKRLAEMEQKRDVLLRDKLRKRTAAQAVPPDGQQDLLQAELEAGEPLAVGQRDETPEQERDETPVSLR